MYRLGLYVIGLGFGVVMSLPCMVLGVWHCDGSLYPSLSQPSVIRLLLLVRIVVSHFQFCW